MQQNQKYVIYKVTNLINDKIYIGKTINFKERMQEHYLSSYNENYEDYNVYFHTAIRKYGFENFRWIILNEFDFEEEAYDWEKLWIKYYKMPNRNIGYNLTEGGEGFNGYKWTDKQLEKVRKYEIEDIKKFVESKGGKCYLDKKINTYTKFLVECENKHQWEVDIRGLLFKETWCPECGGTARKEIDDAKKLAESKGGKCLSKDYKNAREFLLWQCDKKHIWEASYMSVHSGNWCRKCYNKKLEKDSFFKLFNDIKDFLEKNKRLPSLNNKEEVNLATRYYSLRKRIYIDKNYFFKFKQLESIYKVKIFRFKNRGITKKDFLNELNFYLKNNNRLPKDSKTDKKERNLYLTLKRVVNTIKLNNDNLETIYIESLKDYELIYNVKII